MLAKLVILHISPLTWFILALKEALVAKLVILGISSLTLFILALRAVLVAKLVISAILSLIFFILALFCFVYLNQYEEVLIYQHLICILYFPNCLN